MCAVSMVGDHYRDQFQQRPWFPAVYAPMPAGDGAAPVIQVPRSEFEALKKEVEGMKELLKRAKKYDEDNNEPACEVEEKMEVLRKVARLVGVNLDDVIGKSV